MMDALAIVPDDRLLVKSDIYTAGERMDARGKRGKSLKELSIVRLRSSRIYKHQLPNHIYWIVHARPMKLQPSLPHCSDGSPFVAVNPIHELSNARVHPWVAGLSAAISPRHKTEEFLGLAVNERSSVVARADTLAVDTGADH